MRNLVKIKKLILFDPKYLNLDTCYQNFGEKNVRFENITFEVGYKRNLGKIRKLILFGPKYLNLGIWAQHFGKQMSDLKSAPLKQSTC